MQHGTRCLGRQASTVPISLLKPQRNSRRITDLEENEREVELIDYIEVLLRRKGLIAAVTAVSALAVGLWTITSARQYEGQALVVVSQPIASTRSFTLAPLEATILTFHLDRFPTFGRDLLDITYIPILPNKPIVPPWCPHDVVVS